MVTAMRARTIGCIEPATLNDDTKSNLAGQQESTPQDCGLIEVHEQGRYGLWATNREGMIEDAMRFLVRILSVRGQQELRSDQN